MTAAQDAAVLYFALHGTDAPLTCGHWVETVDDKPTIDARGRNLGRLKGSDKCDKPLAGLAHDDGTPLCEEHVRTEGGHPLDFDTVAELWMVKKTLESMQGRVNPRFPQSRLETFALKVAGIDPEPRSTPRTVEARIRGHER